jgi:hypothetical protein
MATSYLDIKANKLNNTLRRQQRLRDNAMPKGSELVGGRNKAEKENRTLRVPSTKTDKLL